MPPIKRDYTKLNEVCRELWLWRTWDNWIFFKWKFVFDLSATNPTIKDVSKTIIDNLLSN